MADYEQNTGYIRFRYRQLAGGAFAQYMSLAPATPLGHFEVQVGNTPGGVGLPSLPANTKRVVLHSVSAALTYTDDGTSPSNTHGMIIPAGVPFWYDTDPDANFKMWCPSNSDVRIAYYG